MSKHFIALILDSKDKLVISFKFNSEDILVRSILYDSRTCFSLFVCVEWSL